MLTDKAMHQSCRYIAAAEWSLPEDKREEKEPGNRTPIRTFCVKCPCYTLMRGKQIRLHLFKLSIRLHHTNLTFHRPPKQNSAMRKLVCVFCFNRPTKTKLGNEKKLFVSSAKPTGDADS